MMDTILVWNVRELGTSRRRLHSIMRRNNSAMVAISEPFATDDKILRLASFLDFPKFCSNV